jgi:predicted transcriptional regulator
MEREVTAEYEPTADQRALVESASALGITQAEIANQRGIDEKTLRKHFRVELKNSGKFKVDMTAGKTPVELMKSGSRRRNITPLAAWAGKRPTSTSRSARTAARSKLRT